MKAKAQAEDPRDLDTINDIADELLQDATEGVKPHLWTIKSAIRSARAAQKTERSMIRPEGE